MLTYIVFGIILGAMYTYQKSAVETVTPAGYKRSYLIANKQIGWVYESSENKKQLHIYLW